MTENNENNLDVEHQKTESCNTCPYKNDYFIDNEDDNVTAHCMVNYFSMIKRVNGMKNKFLSTQIYLIVPRFEKSTDNFCIPQFVINTYDGIKNHYQAKIEKKIYEKLLLLLARCTLAKTLTTMVVCIRGRNICFLSTNHTQTQIASDIFLKSGYYQAENMEYPEEDDDGLITNDHELMEDLYKIGSSNVVQNHLTKGNKND